MLPTMRERADAPTLQVTPSNPAIGLRAGRRGNVIPHMVRPEKGASTLSHGIPFLARKPRLAAYHPAARLGSTHTPSQPPQVPRRAAPSSEKESTVAKST